MRKLIIIIIIFAGISIVGLSQTAMKVHNYYVYYDGDFAKPTITLSTMNPVGKKFYFSTYSLVRYSWGECLLGFDYAVSDWLTLGLKAGIQTESNGTMGRYLATMYFLKGNWNCFGGYEWGGNRDRSQVIFGYRIKAFNPGIMEAHNGDLLGIGPMLEFFIPKTIFAVYGSAMVSPKDGKFLSQFGIYMKFLPKSTKNKAEKKEIEKVKDVPE